MLKRVDVEYKQRTMWRGDTLEWDVELENAETGGPLDITGAKIWFTVKNNYVDPDIRAVVSIDSDTSSGNGAVTIVDAVRGKARIRMEPIATRALPDGPVKLVYDVQIKEASGAVSTIEAGSLTVWPDVTRAIT